MLKIIRVSLDSPNIVVHECPPELGKIRLKPEYCRLTMKRIYGKDGRLLPGRCSQICQHGVMACTVDFIVEFPFLIEGGLSDEKCCQKA